MSSYPKILTSGADPNTMQPSPPSSLCSLSSIETLRSTSGSATAPTPKWKSSRATSNASATTTKDFAELPFPPIYQILGYASVQLEAIAFEILKRNNQIPDMECPEELELNHACRLLPPFCHESLRRTLNDWIPDIRHGYVHRNHFSATAACKTIDEAALFARTTGYEDVAHKLKIIAMEMNHCCIEMSKLGITRPENLPAETKVSIEQRLRGVLAAALNRTEWDSENAIDMEQEVRGYSWEQKIRENPWMNPGAWGQDRNRNYTNSQRSSSPSSPPSSPPLTSASPSSSGNWRQKNAPSTKSSSTGSWAQKKSWGE